MGQNMIQPHFFRIERLLRTLNTLVIFILLTIFSSVCFGQGEQSLAEAIVTSIEEELIDMFTEKSVPGAAMAVVENKEILWEKVYGHLDGEDSGLVLENTIFSIQSMTKSFTALAVLMAVQDGLVDIDTPISEYLPDFTINSIYDDNPEKIITLRHLLSHSAGLVHEAPFGSNHDDRYDFTQHIESISKTWLRYPVGYRYSYSNLGIDLAGYILQVLSGKTYALYVREKVLDPIGMVNSSLDMEIISQEKNRAIGHAMNRTPPLRIPMIPAGGLYTSIRDMAKYLQFHLNKGVVNDRRVLRADLMELMHTIQFAHSGQRFGYCLGLIRDPVSDSYGIYHAGGGYGFTSIMLMFPEKKLGVVLLTNKEEESAIWALRSLVKRTISEKYGPTSVQESGTEQMRELDPEDPRVQAAVGRYGDEHGYVIQFKNDALGLQTGQNVFYPLTFYDDGGDLVGMYGNYSEVRFLPSYNGRRGAMILIDRRLSNTNFNIKDFNDCLTDPPGPNKTHWSEFLGEYELLQNGHPIGSFNVTVRNGHLYAAECKCMEHRPGLFFTYEGETIDFRSNLPMALSIRIRKKEEIE